MLSIGTRKKNNKKYEESRFERGKIRLDELSNEINLMSDVDMKNIKEELRLKPIPFISGSSLLEARLVHARNICRRLERHICSIENAEKICVEYINKLSDYFLSLSIHILHIEDKDSIKLT